MRQQIKRLLVKLGYRLDCIRDVPQHLLDRANTVVLNFDHAVCHRMVEVRRPLRFVQVGAFDGVTRDPIYPYIRDHGWQGILIEPQPHACNALRKLHDNNPNVRVVNAAISTDRGTTILYRVQGNRLPNWCGGLASLSKESILKHKYLIPDLESLIVTDQIPTLRFADILPVWEMGDLDLLQIDTEGYDAEILRLFPFSQVRPSLVHWEIKHLSKSEKEACFDLLLSHGYLFACSGEEDMLAIRTRDRDVGNLYSITNGFNLSKASAYKL